MFQSIQTIYSKIHFLFQGFQGNLCMVFKVFEINWFTFKVFKVPAKE